MSTLDPPATAYRPQRPCPRVGDPAPWFEQVLGDQPNYPFDALAGRYVVLCFFLSAAEDFARRALSILESHRAWFDDRNMAFFGVSIDPADQTRLSPSLPGVRYFWDFDQAISRLYGAVPAEPVSESSTVQPLWFVLDPTLRVIAALPFRNDGADVAQMIAVLEALPPVARFAGVELQAPVLYLPNAFEAEFCDQLIALHEQDGGAPSGFMREIDGKTVEAADPSFKRRIDYTLSDPAVIAATQARVLRRIIPEIEKAHQFKATRIERHIVACYRAEDGGHFAPHRDNTSAGAAHRRFAVSINLNDDYDGGEIGFPEYGPRLFKPPRGAAVVFSCSLLHAVTPMTRGRRYAFLPFLYDEEAARLRQTQNAFLGEGVAPYTMSP